MDKKADFFQKKLSNTRSFARQKKVSRTWIWILIWIFALGALWFGFWKMFLAPSSLDEVDGLGASTFSLWEEVFLEWELKADWDIITHTHTVTDEENLVVWVKSDMINLSDYAWIVHLTWIVEKFYQWMPIVKVLELTWNLAKWQDTDIVLDGNSWVYLLQAWIQFLPSFFDEYLLLNEWENWEILIQNLESWEKIAINYFRCNPSDPNRNCKWLTENFANNSAQSFVTSEWDIFYKQSEIQSWFVANGNWRGIFINDVSDDVVFELKDLIKFANEKTINGWINTRAMKICQWSWEKLQKINNSEISLKQEWLIVTVSWDGNEKQMTCQILVDFSLPAKWVLQNLKIWDNILPIEQWEENKENDVANTQQVEEKSEPQISAGEKLDTNVPQFPVREEWLVYNSSRWGYSLKFPSSNISYSVSSVKENFGRSDISCSYVINVIKYSEKENLEVSPAVRIYECAWSVEESRAPWIFVYPRAGKKFVVQMNDGAWYDFSMNLKIEQLSE